ncbi:MAG: Mini-ribonuclease 3 [Bacillota bacterium]
MPRKKVKINPDQASALVLAYIGDAVYEILVRRHLINNGTTKVKDLHREAVKFVNAGTQARVVHALEDKLTDTEIKVLKRGRNAKSGTSPKNVSMIDYRYGTALEALFGYLYLKGEDSRLAEIFELVKSIVSESAEECGDESKTD